MAQIYHKRGDTLLLSVTWRDSEGNPVDLTPYTITSKVKAVNFELNLTVTKTDATNGLFTCTATATQTATFPVTTSNPSRMFWDIQFTDGSYVVSSETVQIVVIEDIT